MRLWLNDYELNSPERRVYVDAPIEGLDIPTIRTSQGSNTGAHGGYVGAQSYGPRSITIPGHIFASDISIALQRRREIQAALPIYPQFITVRLLDDDGRFYTFAACLIDFLMPISRGRMRSDFKIELLAPDPVIYEDSTGSALSAVINQVVPGGVQFTDTSPQFDNFYFSAGQDSSTVTNASGVTSYPVIVIPGATTSPVLLNQTTGESFSLSGYTVSADQVTQIDMANRTVRLGLVSQLVNGRLPDGVGGNVFGNVPITASWWGLVPGENRIVFTSAGGNDQTEAAVYWRPGYWGI